MKKVIVTGGLGFIGSNLIKILLKKKYFVINIDKVSYSSNFYNVKAFSKNKNYKFLKGDINNEKKILQILKKYKPNAIFNLAAETHVDRSIDEPENFIKSNIFGVFRLLQSFKKFIKKNKKSLLIHISTDEVYGDVLTGRSKEDDQYKPSSPYAASKAASDHLVYSYIRTYNIPAIVTNCSNNFGPRQHPEKLIPKLIYNILNNKNLPIYGKGKNSREWIFVEDHCEALIKVYKSGKLGESYNIGSNINLSNYQLVKNLIKVAEKKIEIGNNVKIIYVKDRPGHDFRYAIDCTKIKRQLKWKEITKIDEGLYKTIQWYYKNQKFFKINSSKIFNKRLGLNL